MTQEKIQGSFRIIRVKSKKGVFSGAKTTKSHKYEHMHIFVRCRNTEANDNKNSFSRLALAGVKPQVAVELRKKRL